MKKYILILMTASSIFACADREDEQVSTALSVIQTLYQEGKYSETLDSISSLRNKYPTAIEARKQALKIWQDASLKMAQADVARTDSALGVTMRAIENEKRLFEANMLRAKRDSLKARYEAMCGVARMIHIRQKELMKEPAADK